MLADDPLGPGAKPRCSTGTLEPYLHAFGEIDADPHTARCGCAGDELVGTLQLTPCPAVPARASRAQIEGVRVASGASRPAAGGVHDPWAIAEAGAAAAPSCS